MDFLTAAQSEKKSAVLLVALWVVELVAMSVGSRVVRWVFLQVVRSVVLLVALLD